MIATRNRAYLAGAVLGIGLLLVLFTTVIRPGPGPARRTPSRHSMSDRRPWIVSRQDRDLYFSDMSRVNAEIRLKPVPGELPDSVRYLLVEALAEDGPLHAAGFRKGDHILKVGGTPIGTMGRAVNLVHEVRKATDLTVLVRRGNETMEYRFEVR